MPTKPKQLPARTPARVKSLHLPNAMVCEQGPMGGIHIVFMRDTAQACEQWATTQSKERQQGFAIYEQVGK